MARTTKHDYTKPIDTTQPLVAAIVVYHREPADKMFVEALESLSLQSYANLECVTVDNRDNTMSIGQARNMGVKATEADLILILSEEDMLTADTVQAMVDLYKLGKSKIPGLIHVTTGCLIQLEDGRQSPNPYRAPGMFERAFLLEEPFEEVQQPDQSMARKMEVLGQLRQVPVTFAVTHHYGYILRVHPFRRDGINVRM